MREWWNYEPENHTGLYDRSKTSKLMGLIIEMRPTFVDAFIISATYMGRDMTEAELRGT
jgi:hypothetical protein